MLPAGGDGLVGAGSGWCGRFGEADCSVEEGGHLGSGGGLVGAEAGSVAASGGDGRCCELGHFGGVPVVGVYVFEVGGGCVGQVEGSRQEHRHLCSGHVAVRAVAGSVAASMGDFELGEAFDEVGAGVGDADVGEAGGCDWLGVFAVEDAHGPHRHGGAVQRLVGAESLCAAGAGEHALGVEGVDGGLVNPAGHV